MSKYLYGSICLSDVPKELFKRAESGKVYLNIKITERKKPSKYGKTHNISCEPPKEQRKEGVNYYCGDLKVYNPQPAQAITPEEVSQMPPTDDLPFD